MESLKPVGDKMVSETGRGDSDERRQEMYRYVLGALSNGYLNYVNMDLSRPTWAPLWNHAYNYGGPNPDYAYMSTLVEPSGVYRISGYRGTSRFVEITQQVFDYLSDENLRAIREKNPSAKSLRARANDLDTLRLDKHGYFSVILSPEKPAGYEGDWWPLDPNTRSLLMRKASANWRHEIDPRVAIDRLDKRPPMTAEESAVKFSELKNWAAGIIAFDTKLAAHYREHHGVNTIKKSDLMASSGAWPDQVYLDGAFEIAADEALILETKIPDKCRYWQILLADNRFATIDWVNRQSSLNDYQARLDPDGRFRAVISEHDPGVPNWLDTGGEPWGIIQMRWNRCNEAPTPQVKKVRLADARKHLPQYTPVITPAVRAEQLRARREAAQLRHLW